MERPSTNNGAERERDAATPRVDDDASNEEEGEETESEKEEDELDDDSEEEFNDEEGDEFSDGLGSEFGEDASLDHGLEPTDFSESLHVSDLMNDEDLPEQEAVEEVPPANNEGGETEKKDGMNKTGLLVAGAVGLGALGGAALFAAKLRKSLNQSDAIDSDDAVAAIQHQSASRMGESAASQSSSGNIGGVTPV